MDKPLWNLQAISLGQRLREISTSLQPGVTAVLGHSGAGKTSLLNLLVRFERPTSGTISEQLPRGQHRLPVFWVPQDHGLWPHLTVRQHLETVGEKDSEALLTALDLGERAGSFPATLSLGERARLAVARALAADAAVWVMDEPLGNVDPARTGKYWEVIRAHRAQSGASLVFATHSPPAVLAEAERVICLKEGRLLNAGDVEQLYWNPPSQEVADCLGEGNWLSPEESRFWLQRDERAARCFRPEQIVVATAAASPFVVESSRFGGAVAEVRVRHEPTNAERRFFHRPSGNHLVRGTRVLLKAAVLLCMGLHLAGCGGKSDPTLPVSAVHVWPVPAEGVKLPAPRCVGIGRHDEVLILDTAGRVLVYNADGSLARQWHMPESQAGNPEGVCMLRDGRIVVCDTHYHRVVIFDERGQVVKMFGSEGTGPGQFIYPVAVTTDDQENLYVAEYGSNDRIQKFTRDGEFVLAFGSFGTEQGQFQRPSGIVWQAGQMYVADAFNHRIQVFTDDGKFLRVLETPALKFPYDLKLGREAALYVIEYGAARVTKLSLDGQLLGRYGSPGGGLGQFVTPWGLGVDSRGRLRIADTGNRRLVELVM